VALLQQRHRFQFQPEGTQMNSAEPEPTSDEDEHSQATDIHLAVAKLEFTDTSGSLTQNFRCDVLIFASFPNASQCC
jgi:hypothetical protein